MDLTQEIKRLAEAELSAGQYVVSADVSARKGPKKVLVLVDGDEGFTIDDCAELSRKLSKQLDDLGLIDDNYLLEVSTPGVDFPLKLNRQYRKNIGRSLKIKMTNGENIEGKLTDVTEENLTISQQVKTGKKFENVDRNISFKDIDKAFVIVSFK